MLLQILKYNNYYNRLVKRELTLEDYQDYVVYQIDNTNFNPNDNIATEHIIGNTNIPYDGKGDYVLAINEDNEIVSRWFIIEAKRTRGGQYNLQLYRDTVVDYYNLIISSPVFIEKATLSLNDPLLFNSENMTYNQILTNEYLIKDASNCAWIVGYYSKNTADVHNFKGDVPTNPDIPAKVIDEETFNILNGGTLQGVPTQTSFIVNARRLKSYDNYVVSFIMQSGSSLTTLTNNAEGTKYYAASWGWPTVRYQYTEDPASKLRANMSDSLYNSCKAMAPNYVPTTSKEYFDTYYAYNGTKVKYGNFYYEVSFKENGTPSSTYKTIPINSELWNTLKDQWGNGAFSVYSPNEYSFGLEVTSKTYTITLTKLSQFTLKYDLSDLNKITTLNEPYNLFAIPYGEISIKGIAGIDTLTTNQDLAVQVASAIKTNHGSFVYDIQLLPYCPIQELIESNGVIRVTNSAQYSLITTQASTTDVKGIIFNLPSSKVHTTIPFAISRGTSSLERKVNNECDKWRLTSPNYSNYFDFSVEKNSGIQYFDVDCDYKPYSPYIHINPNFDGLYGYDDNSPRGLVLGGDFSLTQIVDQWTEYQIQNKNFQNIFDRQIQNMEVNNNVQREKEIWTASVGVLQGILTGVAGGGFAGGSGGAVVGGIAGGVLSALGGARDIQLNEMLRNEAIDYTKDQFGYQLGNIQALPQTISKVSAFNSNNKIFPVLEYYTATEKEKQALKDKVKYNGMTVMAIGKIEEYLQSDRTYIKGQLIRFEDSEEDFNIVNTIANELNKGVYIN